MLITANTKICLLASFIKAAESTQVILYFRYCLLSADELVSPKDIDPIGRYVPPQDQRNVSMRFSNQVSVC